MGTRGLLGFIIRGVKRGIYNNTSSYPSGLGGAIVSFILSLKEGDMEIMIERLESLTWVDIDDPVPPEVAAEYLAKGYNESDHSRERRLALPLDKQARALRELAGDYDATSWHSVLRGMDFDRPLRSILNTELHHAIDAADFAHDGLFCEWAYWIDFEKRNMEMEGDGKVWLWKFEELRDRMFDRDATLERNIIDEPGKDWSFYTEVFRGMKFKAVDTQSMDRALGEPSTSGGNDHEVEVEACSSEDNKTED